MTPLGSIGEVQATQACHSRACTAQKPFGEGQQKIAFERFEHKFIVYNLFHFVKILFFQSKNSEK